MSATKVVEDFIGKWNERDFEGMMSFFQEDAFYHNMPMEPSEGVAAIREGLTPFFGMAEEINWQIFYIADCGDGVVMTERRDDFKINGKWLRLPVMGTFEIKDGKIAKWRDYFDLKDFETQMAAVSS